MAASGAPPPRVPARGELLREYNAALDQVLLAHPDLARYAQDPGTYKEELKELRKWASNQMIQRECPEAYGLLALRENATRDLQQYGTLHPALLHKVRVAVGEVGGESSTCGFAAAAASMSFLSDREAVAKEWARLRTELPQHRAAQQALADVYPRTDPGAVAAMQCLANPDLLAVQAEERRAAKLSRAAPVRPPERPPLPCVPQQLRVEFRGALGPCEYAARQSLLAQAAQARAKVQGRAGKSRMLLQARHGPSHRSPRRPPAAPRYTPLTGSHRPLRDCLAIRGPGPARQRTASAGVQFLRGLHLRGAVPAGVLDVAFPCYLRSGAVPVCTLRGILDGRLGRSPADAGFTRAGAEDSIDCLRHVLQPQTKAACLVEDLLAEAEEVPSEEAP